MADKEMEKDEVLSTLRSIDRKLNKLNNPPLWRSLLQGMLTGLGTVIGATLLLAILLAVLRPLISAPVVGQWISDIVNTIDLDRDGE